MQNMNELSKNTGITRAFPQWTSNYCYEHIPTYALPVEPTETEIAAAQEKFRVQMMLTDGLEVCPRCACDNETKRLEDEANEQYKHLIVHEKHDILKKQSVYQDETIKVATFDNYLLDSDQHEARTNLQKVMHAIEDYKQGKRFNFWFTGNVGVGKSHLSESMLVELCDIHTSCLFIDVDQMLRLIRDSFNNKESKYTENYFIELTTKVDFLVLDDLGAETGNIDTGKTASDYTSKVLRAIVNGRQDKSTIFTTNLSYKKLVSMYDAKLVDRMLKDARLIKYIETISHRTKNVSF